MVAGSPSLRAARIATLALLTAALSVACTSPNIEGARPPAVHSFLEPLATSHRICNVAVAIIRNRRLDAVDTAQGCLSASAVQAASVFEAASLGKPLFAYAVLRLVQAGAMDLDAPVMRYLPDGYRHAFEPWRASSPSEAVTDPRLQAVTVRMLLNHSSGLPNWAGGPLHFDFAPGALWQYSGEGYLLLQRAVEAVTHQSLDRFMAAQVFEPLGMHHSGYRWEARFDQEMIGPESDPVRRFAAPVAAFTLYTSAADYGRFLTALLNDTRTIRQIVEAPVPVDDKRGLEWGAGWGLERHGDDDLVLWQWGNNPGYRAFVIASLRSGNGLVMLSNSDNGLALAEPLTQALLPGPHPLLRLPQLRNGLAYTACESLGLCP